MKLEDLIVALARAMDNDSANASQIRLRSASFFPSERGMTMAWIGCGPLFASADADDELRAKKNLLRAVQKLARVEAKKHEAVARRIRALLLRKAAK